MKAKNQNRTKYSCITILVFLVLFGVSPSAKAKSEEAQLDSPADQIEKMIKEWVDPDGPGVAVSVISQGEVIYKKGFGLANLEHNIPITPTTVFNFGSIAKQFTGFGIALLAYQGKISLDDDIRKYLPEMPNFGKTITIRNLVHHTSGLREIFNMLKIAGYMEEDLITNSFVLKMLANQKELNFSPGEKWLYCNTGYSLLAEIITRVTGFPFPQWMQENVFQPLKMTHTQFMDDIEIVIPNRADSYIYYDGQNYKKHFYNSAEVGCSNLYSCLDDMEKWIGNLKKGKVGGPDVLEMIQKRGVLNNGELTNYGFGLFIKDYKGLKLFDHSGRIASYLSYMALFPEKDLAVIVISNVSYFDPVFIARQIFDLFLSDNKKVESVSKEAEIIPDSKTVQTIALEPEVLKSYVGKYRLTLGGKLLEVSIEKDKLYLKNLSDVPLELSPFSEDRFLVEEIGADIFFIFGNDDKIARIELQMGSRKLTANRVEEIYFSEQEMEEFCGQYFSPELNTIYTVVNRDGIFIAFHRRLPETELTPLSKSDFSGANTWLRNIKFERNEKNEVTGFRVTVLGTENILFKKFKWFWVE